MTSRANAFVGQVAWRRPSLDATAHTAHRLHFLTTFQPLVVEGRSQVDQRESGCHILSVLLAGAVALADFISVQLQTCIVAHAGVLHFLLL